MTAIASAPTLTFRLVGKWTHIPLTADPERTRAVRAFVKDALGGADELASQREGMRRQIREAADAAASAGGQAMFIASEIAPDVPLPVTMTLYAPDELRMSPSVGTAAEQVIATAEEALRVLETPGIDTATTLVHPQTHALRLHRFQDSVPQIPQEFSSAGDGEAPDGLATVSTMIVDYWVAVPDSKRTVLVNFFTPIIHVPHLMLALFDGIVQAAYFAEDDE